MNDDVDELAESIDLETVRRDKPVEYAGRVQKLGFREGLLVAGGLIVILAGAGVVAIGPAGPHGSAPPSNVAGASLAATAAPTPVATAPVPSPTSPGPTPAATPSVICSSRPTNEPPYVNLLVPRAHSVGNNRSIDWLPAPPGPVSAEEAASTTVELGDRPVLSVNFGACALEWRVLLNGEVIEQQSNPSMDPAYARQAYFVLPIQVNLRSSTLQLDLHYPAGWSSTAWQLNVDSWPFYLGYAVVGSQLATALPGCGFSIQLTSGASGGETCTTDVPDGIASLYVPPSTDVVFRVPGAVFTPASTGAVACGHVKGTPPAFVIDPTCPMDLGSDALGDYHLVSPSRVGIHVVEITGCATFNGGQACGPWFVRIDSVHPEPTPEGIVN